MKARSAVLLLLCLPLYPLAAQLTLPGTTPGAAPASPAAAPTAPAAPSAQSGTTKPDLSVPKDKKDKWVVGFCGFNAERLPAEDTYLTFSIPLMLKDQLAGISTHTIGLAERELIRKAAVARELASLDQALTGFAKERDTVFFETENPTVAATANVDARIAAAHARRDFLLSLDLARIEVADQKPLEVKAGGASGNLLDPLSIPASVFCERQGIDLLVGGMIREVEGYVLLDVWAYDAASATVTLSYRDAARREEVYQSVPAAGRGLTTLFLGKPWASLSFAADPPESSLYIDGKLVATGRTPTLYLSPGTRDIRVSAPGYQDLSRSLRLDADQETTLDVTLEKMKTGRITISSTPSGSDVYVESVWKGKTPISLEKPFGRTRVAITANGFYDEPFSISDASPAELSFLLSPDTVSRDAVQKKARDEFYDAFAWFAVSLPIPIFCYALALDAAVQYNQLIIAGNLPAASGAQLRANLLYGGYLVGSVASATLFTWMLLRIIHYVTVSTRTAG
ncbi:MAG TPA: PEGA domain-containing protein [Spirochaetia bacterium]|nr:PEGA domain-containing protein [Spirochaetia bacterium]